MSKKARDEKYQYDEPPTPQNLASGIIVSPDAQRQDRLPPGQSRTRKWPVLDASGTPDIATATWELNIFGLVTKPLTFDLAKFQTLPRVKVFADFHCVTHWSRLGNLWEGVSTRELIDRSGACQEAKFVVLHGYDKGWTTNLSLTDFLAADALIADLHDGTPISADHGGPVRAMVPQRYAWKSAKWLKAIELVATDQPGYWERCGYHNQGDPWSEERFGG